MNQARLKRELKETRGAGLSWGHALFDQARLPIDHSFIPRSNNTPRRASIEAVFHRALFEGYLDAAEFAGETVPS